MFHAHFGRRSAPQCSHDIIMLFKHICNIIISEALKTLTNIIILLSDIIAGLAHGQRSFFTRTRSHDRSQLYLTDIIHWLMSYISENLAEITRDYIWLARCCNNATEIADTFNGMHLAGVLVCKSFSILCHEPGVTGKTVSAFFPAYSAIHVCPTSIRDMTYSELVVVRTSL